jgi:putative membrane protein
MDRRAGRGNHNNIIDMKLSIVLFAGAILLECGHATAQDKSNDTTARYFIIQASIGNLQETAMGQLAAEQAVSPQLKAFGQRMVADHGKAEAQLKQLIQAKGFRIPGEATEPPAADPMLKNAPPKDFDRMYVHMMVPDHRQTVQLFEKYVLTGKDPDVRAYAQQTLPVLKEHLAAIVAIDQAMKDAKAQ